MSSLPSISDYDSLAELSPSYLLPIYSIIDANLVSNCKTRNIDIASWTVDKSSIRQTLEDLGVRKIMSNYNLGVK